MTTGFPYILLSIPGGAEWVYILLVIIILFYGGKKIPELARGIGKGIKEFKDAKNGKEEEKKKEDSGQ